MANRTQYVLVRATKIVSWDYQEKIRIDYESFTQSQGGDPDIRTQILDPNGPNVSMLPGENEKPGLFTRLLRFLVKPKNTDSYQDIRADFTDRMHDRLYLNGWK